VPSGGVAAHVPSVEDFEVVAVHTRGAQ